MSIRGEAESYRF